MYFHSSGAEEAAAVVQAQKSVWDGVLAVAILAVEDRTDSTRTWWVIPRDR
jgi:hypothetical protein